MMGTNFHWTAPDVERYDVELVTGHKVSVGLDFDNMDPNFHIGKRSAAGLYCWDCEVTLCPGGESQVHMGRGDEPWPDVCPRCGETHVKEWLTAGAAAVELGFAEPRPGRPSGVRGCSSFSWAQDPDKVRAICGEHLDDEIIADEYGRKMTGRAFLDMVEANCPIQFTRSVGKWFS
jgi:hypothetical protein